MNRFAYIALHVVLYSAIMLGLAWVLGLVMPGLVAWLQDNLGLYVASALLFSIIPLGWWLSYRLGRSDSGSARDP